MSGSRHQVKVKSTLTHTPTLDLTPVAGKRFSTASGAELAITNGPSSSLSLSVEELIHPLGGGGQAARGELEKTGAVGIPAPTGWTLWNPTLSAWLAMRPILQRLAVDAHAPMLLAGFDDLDWAAIHKDLSVEVEGIPSPVALSNPFYTVGTPPRPGFGHHPTPLNAVELEAAFREPHANWVSYMWRGDLAFECNEPYPFDDHRRLSA